MCEKWQAIKPVYIDEFCKKCKNKGEDDYYVAKDFQFNGETISTLNQRDMELAEYTEPNDVYCEDNETKYTYTY